jgi:membrane protease YdiL (CAAX protease family)|tara:strand:- start:14366 stop:15178 length:813 start_codon:yes stop_codon:yes gene_type:complete
MSMMSVMHKLNPRVAFTIVILSFILSALLTTGTYLLLQSNNSSLASSIVLIVGDIILILPLLLLLIKSDSNIKDVLRLKSVPYPVLSATFILSIGIVFWADELDRLVAIILPPPDWITASVQNLQADGILSFFLLLIGAVFLAATVEEILFRGFLQQILEKHWKNVTKGVLVTSLFFALIHLNPWWVIQIYLMGILLGYLAWKTNSVFPSILFHAMNNGMALLYTNWSDKFKGIYEWNGHVSPLLLIMGAFLVSSGLKKINSINTVPNHA